MRQLVERLPDPDHLLALPPEELGRELLFAIKANTEGMFTLTGIVQRLAEAEMRLEQPRYPRDRMHEIGLALREAFAWLETQVLIIPAEGINGENGYRVLSRLARRLQDETDFDGHMAARTLNRDLLHPAIRETVWLSLMRSELAEAVFKAMRAVEIAVREAAGYAEGDHGVPMIRRAFHKDTGPLRDPNQEEAEREALMHLFAGAIGSYKNPHSHRNVPLDDADETIEIVMLASHLLRIVDARRSAMGTGVA